ncbi:MULTISPECIES: hypothetical protein [unclassified Streptomyces]|uniref:hypothetical protein n=1 Tax=unclassified Streptomyces TaxID=2593676 RepID=UPI0033C6E2BE
MSGGESPERPVEVRLRRALAARAQTVTVRDLRPADPPGPHLRRTALLRSWPPTPGSRRLALPLAALATAAAVAIGYLAVEPGGAPDHPLPAATPGPVSPGPVSPHPSPHPSRAESPRPEPSTPPTKARRPARPSARTPGTTPQPDTSAPPRTPPPRSTGLPSLQPSRTPSPPATR